MKLIVINYRPIHRFPGLCGYQSLCDFSDFFQILQPKITDFAAAFLKIYGDICGISYSFAV